ncbi:MAG: sigma 54-interacting transcriptional regulator [Deltaproteobacteria bacterium]|nr:sigma 54-interacting transcriptional regulator [Deltaproteobacteria bacterium]
MDQNITYEQIINATNNGIIATDVSGTIVYINQQAEKMLGCNAEKHTGISISELLPITGRQVMDCLKTGTSKWGHHVIGEKFDMVLNITLIRKGKKLGGTVCNFQDMKQLKILPDDLESRSYLNQQLKTIFKASHDGLWVCDGQGKVIDVNKASEKLNGIHAADIIGKNVRDLVDGGLFDRSVTLEVIETKRRVSVIQKIKRTKKLLLATGTPAFDDEGNIFLVVINERDMTQLNAIQKQLEQSRMVTEKYKNKLAELSLLELKDQEIVAEDKKMRQVLHLALKLAHLSASDILILGESGTGKGLLAKFIHKNSNRNKKPFVQINCATLPENLLEAELFGYEKGAFTGARQEGKAGLFELAHEGTLFLDEIGDLPHSLQAKLLKYLDDHEAMRLGGLKSKKIDSTIIAATNRNLEGLVQQKRFRRDLFFRLNTFTIRIPPLRERIDDIFELVSFYMQKYGKAYRLNRRISPDALKVLQAYPFPGNVRELKNVIKKAVLMSERHFVDDVIFQSLPSGMSVFVASVDDSSQEKGLTGQILHLEKDILQHALRCCRTTREMGRFLKISQPTVVRKLKKHKLYRKTIQ